MTLETVVKLIMNEYCVRCSNNVVLLGSIPVKALACESFPARVTHILRFCYIVFGSCCKGLRGWFGFQNWKLYYFFIFILFFTGHFSGLCRVHGYGKAGFLPTDDVV